MGGLPGRTRIPPRPSEGAPFEQDFPAAPACSGLPSSSYSLLKRNLFGSVKIVPAVQAREGGEALPPEHSVSLPAAWVSGFLLLSVCRSALFDQMNPRRKASASAPGYKPTRAVLARPP
ncbi:MAG: hypothetical protein METHAR1v1_1080009 [Methanothrix sp.]|nr:MAG: hypothetical protein METHAR1v1_1080009 [Methanothrix sp.]